MGGRKTRLQLDGGVVQCCAGWLISSQIHEQRKWPSNYGVTSMKAYVFPLPHSPISPSLILVAACSTHTHTQWKDMCLAISHYRHYKMITLTHEMTSTPTDGARHDPRGYAGCPQPHAVSPYPPHIPSATTPQPTTKKNHSTPPHTQQAKSDEKLHSNFAL